jgi:hypothetical protein
MLTMVWKDIGMPIYSSDVAYTLNKVRRCPQSRKG